MRALVSELEAKYNQIDQILQSYGHHIGKPIPADKVERIIKRGFAKAGEKLCEHDNCWHVFTGDGRYCRLHRGLHKATLNYKPSRELPDIDMPTEEELSAHDRFCVASFQAVHKAFRIQTRSSWQSFGLAIAATSDDAIDELLQKNPNLVKDYFKATKAVSKLESRARSLRAKEEAKQVQRDSYAKVLASVN